MKKIVATTILVLIVKCSIAQNDTTLNRKTISKNSLYAEFLGNGILGSINYDRLFFIKKMKFSARAGAFYFPRNKVYGPAFSIPVELNLLLGNKHHAEFGLGVSYLHGYDTMHDSNENIVSSKYITLITKPIGYRFQKLDGGFFFKVSALVAFNLIQLNKMYIPSKNLTKILPYAGISIGYTFKNKKS